MMQYDFVDESTEIGGMNSLDTKENMQMYQTYPQQDRYRNLIRNEFKKESLF